MLRSTFRCLQRYCSRAQNLSQSCSEARDQRLHDVLFEKSDYAGEKEKFDCFVGLPSDDDKNPFMSPKMKIMDVPRYEHFDNDDYPEDSSYFMYGDKTTAFLFHIPTKIPDYFQVNTYNALN